MSLPSGSSGEKQSQSVDSETPSQGAANEVDALRVLPPSKTRAIIMNSHLLVTERALREARRVCEARLREARTEVPTETDHPRTPVQVDDQGVPPPPAVSSKADTHGMVVGKVNTASTTQLGPGPALQRFRSALLLRKFLDEQQRATRSERLDEFCARQREASAGELRREVLIRLRPRVTLLMLALVLARVISAPSIVPASIRLMLAGVILLTWATVVPEVFALIVILRGDHLRRVTTKGGGWPAWSSAQPFLRGMARTMDFGGHLRTKSRAPAIQPPSDEEVLLADLRAVGGDVLAGLTATLNERDAGFSPRLREDEEEELLRVQR